LPIGAGRIEGVTVSEVEMPVADESVPVETSVESAYWGIGLAVRPVHQLGQTSVKSKHTANKESQDGKSGGSPHSLIGGDGQ
jgi:hypothetical protein